MSDDDWRGNSIALDESPAVPDWRGNSIALDESPAVPDWRGNSIALDEVPEVPDWGEVEPAPPTAEKQPAPYAGSPLEAISPGGGFQVPGTITPEDQARLQVQEQTPKPPPQKVDPRYEWLQKEATVWADPHKSTFDPEEKKTIGRTPKEYDVLARTFARQFDLPVTDNLRKNVAQWLDLYDVAAGIALVDPGPFPEGFARTAVRNIPRELWPDLEAAVAHLASERGPQKATDPLTRTVGMAAGGIWNTISRLSKLSPFTPPDPYGDLSEEQGQFASRLVTTAQRADPLVHPEEGILKRGLMTAAGAIPQIAMSAIGGPVGVATIFGAPTAQEVYESSRARGAGHWQALTAAMGAGAVETVLFSGVLGRIKNSLGGEQAVKQQLVDIAKRYTWDSVKTGGTLSVAGLQKRMAEEGALWASGKAGKSAGDLWQETISTLPDELVAGFILHTPGAVRGAVSRDGILSRKAVGDLFGVRSSEEERAQAVKWSQEQKTPEQPRPQGEPDALEKQKAGEVYGDVGTRPGEGEGPGRPDEGGEGVQPIRRGGQPTGREAAAPKEVDSGGPDRAEAGVAPPGPETGEEFVRKFLTDPEGVPTEDVAKLKYPAIDTAIADLKKTYRGNPEGLKALADELGVVVPKGQTVSEAMRQSIAGRLTSYIKTQVTGESRTDASDKETAKFREPGEQARQEAEALGVKVPPRAPPVVGESPETQSIKNAFTEAERERRGLPPREPPVRATHEEAMRVALEKTPEEIDTLLDEVRDKPRALYPHESAMLLRRQNELNQKHQQALKEKNDSKAAELEKALADTYTIDESVGTQSGQSLEFRKVEIANDNSIKGQTRRRIEAREGKPLTPEDRKIIRKQAEELDVLRDQLRKNEEQRSQEASKAAFEAAKAKVNAKRQQTIETRIREQYRTASEHGVNPEELRAMAEDMAEAETKSVADYNAALRAVVKNTGLTPAVIRDIENRPLVERAGIGRGKPVVDITEYHGLDAKATHLAKEHKALGLRSDSPNLVEDLVRLIKEGVKPEPKWYDKLEEAAQRLAAERPPVAVPEGASDLAWEAARVPGLDPWILRDAPKGKPLTQMGAPRQRAADSLTNFMKVFHKGEGLVKGEGGAAGPVDPERFAAAVEVVRAHVDLGATLFKEFWHKVRKWFKPGELRDVESLFKSAWDQEREAGNIGRPVGKMANREQVSRLADRLLTSALESGIKDHDQAIDSVHEGLKEVLPKITRGEAMDALSRRGQYTELSKEAIEVERRAIKDEAREERNLEDVQAGKVPPKTGREHAELTDRARQARGRRMEEMKRSGLIADDPARQLKTVQAARKTAIRNWLRDRAQEIATGEKIIRERRPLVADKELKQLQQQKAELQAIHDAVFAGENEAAKNLAAERALDRIIAKDEANLKEGKIGRRTPLPRRSTPAIEAKRSRLDYIRALREEARAHNPEYQADLQARNLASYKRVRAGRLADLEAKLVRMEATGEVPAKKPIVRKTKLDKEAEALNLKVAKTNQKIRTGEAKIRRSNRLWWEKGADLGKKGVRFGVLTHPGTFVKLFVAAVSRVVEALPREVIRGGLAKLPYLRKIAPKATIYGGFDLKAALHGIYEGATTGMVDAAKTLVRGQSDWDVLHGERGSMGEGRHEEGGSLLGAAKAVAGAARERTVGSVIEAGKEVGEAVLDFPGQSHGAFKAPVKRMGYEYAVEKSTKKLAKLGFDTTDPKVQEELQEAAADYARSQIFLENNKAVDVVNKFLRAKIDPETGHAYPVSKAKELAAGVKIPIRRIPANIVAQVFDHLTGLATGTAGARRAFRKGIENLSIEEANTVFRHLERGVVGAGIATAIMFIGAKWIGSYYQPGQRKRDEELKPGEVKVAGQKLPKAITHTVPGGVAQFVSSVKDFASQKLKSSDEEEQGYGMAAVAGLLGLADEVPFVRETLHLGDLWDPNRRRYYIGETVKTIVVPGFAQDVAKWQDTDALGDVTKRDPRSLWEEVKMGIPGRGGRRSIPRKGSR